MGGCKLRLYEHWGSKGRFADFSTSSSNLHNSYVGGNRASSWKKFDCSGVTVRVHNAKDFHGASSIIGD